MKHIRLDKPSHTIRQYQTDIVYNFVCSTHIGLYYYGFLVNEGIGLISVIQTFCPCTLTVLYNKYCMMHYFSF